MKSKLMTLAFVGALALSAVAPNAVAAAGNAHGQGSAVQSRRLSPTLVHRTAGAARGSKADLTQKPFAVSSKKK